MLNYSQLDTNFDIFLEAKESVNFLNVQSFISIQYTSLKFCKVLLKALHCGLVRTLNETGTVRILNETKSSVVDNTLDYRSRGRKIDSPLLRSSG